MSIKPNAIHWEPNTSVGPGRDYGSASEIGLTYLAADGWYAQIGNDDFGPYTTNRQAQLAAEKFVANGYEH